MGQTEIRVETRSEGGEMVLYQPDEKIRIEVRVDADTVWLTRQQMANLFGRDVKTIGKHINNALREELAVSTAANDTAVLRTMTVVAKFATTANDGKVYQTEHYSLDMILSVGYRVHSPQGILFRQWATKILKQHLLQGYSINRQVVAIQQHVDERLLKIEDRLDRQQEDINFYIKTNQKPTEFVIPTGCVWDAYSYLSELVRTARKRIILIDNFIDDRTLLLLDKRAAGVEATVYTRYSDKAELDFVKHNAQYSPVKRIQLSKAVHDRYLIVDEDVWLLGASVKDMGRGLTTVIGTGISSDYILACVG